MPYLTAVNTFQVKIGFRSKSSYFTVL